MRSSAMRRISLAAATRRSRGVPAEETRGGRVARSAGTVAGRVVQSEGRRTAALMLVLAAAMTASTTVAPPAAGGAAAAEARRAAPRSLRATDRATLHYVSSSVNVFYETGEASGTIPGFMKVHMRLGSRFSGEYVIDAKGGSIHGYGSATPHGRGTYESFAGTIVVTGGSGRFAHAHGRARVYGTFDRMNNQLKLHTTGTLYF